MQTQTDPYLDIQNRITGQIGALSPAAKQMYLVYADPNSSQLGMGIPGGPRNPIGARGLYLWQGNVDTLYREFSGTDERTSAVDLFAQMATLAR